MGTYIRLVDYGSQQEKENAFLAAVNGTATEKIRFNTNEENFSKIPGSPIAYWVSEKFKKIFDLGTPMEIYANARQGMKTCDNERFIRLWFEVSNKKSCFSSAPNAIEKRSNYKWFPINHGGAFRRYYGNNCELVNWSDDGKEIKELAIKKYGCITRTVTNIPYYFKDGITWTVISSGKAAFRRYYSGHLFSNSGQSIVPDNPNIDLDYLCALLNSVVILYVLSVLAPTLGFESGYLKLIPIIDDNNKNITDLAESNINISHNDWDSFETSWDFKKNPLV